MTPSEEVAIRVLLVTASRALPRQIAQAAKTLAGVSLRIARNPAETVAILETALIDLLMIDLPSLSRAGIELLRNVRQSSPAVSVLVITDRDLRDYDREAIRLGVEGFIVHPVRGDHVRFMIQKVQETRRLRDRYHLLQEESFSALGGLVGSSAEMKQVYHMISRAASSMVPVALYGESGTGKELVARAIHETSPRRAGPFVAVNPTSIPETLLEGELFGYVKGAFTGAQQDRIGYFEAAHGGTLFLDELGDVPLPFQVKLLRVLQEKTIQRIGSSRLIRVDFRLITATHRDLMAAVRSGRFREDLFYRIHVFPIYLPPLRSRKEDIPLLAEHFLRRFRREMGEGPRGFGPGVLELLGEYPWPGNVRELENVVHRLFAMKPPDSLIEVSDLAQIVGIGSAPLSGASGRMPTGAPAVRPLKEHMDDYILWAYHTLGRNKARTARLLEIDRSTLYRKLREMGADDAPDAAR
jgi:two-component system response regulator AtoC